MKKLFGMIAVLLFVQAAAMADIRPPSPAPTKSPVPVRASELEMYIAVTSEVSEPTLSVRTGAFNKLRGSLDEGPGEDRAVAGMTSLPNIVGGLFLTLSIAFAGIWLARSQGNVPKAAVGAVVLAVLGGATVIVANVAPPRNFGINQSMFKTEFAGRAYAKGKVKVRIDPFNDGQDVRLLVPYQPDAAKGGE